MDPDLEAVLAGVAIKKLPPLDGALVRVAVGDLDRAIAGLTLTARIPAQAGEAFADLSAVYLARFSRENDLLDLLRSIDAADHALRVAPSDPAARFNRAMALTRLGARLTGVEACRRAQPAALGGWRTEVAEQLQELSRPTGADEWASVVRRIDWMPAPQLRAATLRMPAAARTYAEEVLLPRWAATVSSDRATADRALQMAAAIGTALASSGRDELLRDAIESIQRTMANGSDVKREQLIRGIHAFGEGVRQYNEQNLETARPALTACIADLASTGNPLCDWARFYLSISDYYVDASRGLADLDALLQSIPHDRYFALVGRIEWIEGTVDTVQGRIQSSVRRYERSEAALRRAGGDAGSAFVNVLLAESYTALGEHAMAWESRGRAFRSVPFCENPRRNIAMWTEGKEALVRQGDLALAGPLVEEAVAYAEEWGRPLGRASAYLDRAAYRLDIGMQAQASADLARAKDAIAHMEPSGLREQMRYLALITEGLLLRRDDPKRAAALLQQALDAQAATGTRFDAITYTTALANAQITSGDSAGGEKSLERALALFETVRATVEDPVSRMQAFRQAQPAFDALLELRLKRHATGDALFLLAERSRARVLLDLRRRGGPENFASIADVERALPERTVVANFVSLRDGILVWVVHRGHSRQLLLAVKRADIEQAIDRFRLELRQGNDVDVLRAVAAPLYDALIRPLGLMAGDGRSLIIVPDRSLARLPFAALYDRESGEYLEQQRAVAIAPSATLLLQGVASRGLSQRVTAVALGVPFGGTYRGRDLPPLRQSEKEAAAVAALYSAGSLLNGHSATKENFLRKALSADVIHFGGHAVVDVEAPRRSVLLFAKPVGAGLEPLSLEELFTMRVGAPSLVVLSACRAQDSLADDREGPLGLAGAFVAAGAREVLASPIDVDDSLALPVMVQFHRRYRTERSAALAFHRAVVDLIRAGPPELRSPAAWGRFTVIEGSLQGGGMK